MAERLVHGNAAIFSKTVIDHQKTFLVLDKTNDVL